MAWSSSPTAHTFRRVAAEEAQHLELRAVGVLVLVDEHVQEPLLPAREDGRVVLPEARDLADQVVEVERLVLPQGRLVARVDLPRDLVVGVARPGRAAPRPTGTRSCAFEMRARTACASNARSAPAAAQQLLDERRLVALVEDGERAARRRPLALQDAEAEGVERAHRERPRRGRAFLPSIFATRSRISPAALLVKVSATMAAGGIAALDQAHDAVRDDARLARAGAGQHEQRPSPCSTAARWARLRRGGAGMVRAWASLTLAPFARLD